MQSACAEVAEIFKKCAACGQHLPLSAFYLSRSEHAQVTGRCKPCANAHVNAWRKANVERSRDNLRYAGIKRKYGLSKEAPFALLASQGGRCAICRAVINIDDRTRKTNLAVDHDHATGRPRGILCRPCNSGIGHLGDDPLRVEAAARYLRLRLGGV